MDNHSVAAESFQTPVPLPRWNASENDNATAEEENETDKPWNCFGVVHVRMLAAQHLPCPVGSTVSATVSLFPWRGKVRTSQTSAFSISMEHGVCVAWDPNTDKGVCSMVHAWNSEDSPVPDVKIDLNFSPLGLGFFEFKMASLTLPCEVLLKSPNKWKRQWCQAEQDEAAKRDATGLGPILIQLEAIFIPGPANINSYLPDPDEPENRIDYVDQEDNSVSVSRMSGEDVTSVESDINDTNDEGMMDQMEGQSTVDTEGGHLDKKAQHTVTPNAVDSKQSSQEATIHISSIKNKTSDHEDEGLPDIAPTTDSGLDQDQEVQEQTELRAESPHPDQEPSPSKISTREDESAVTPQSPKADHASSEAQLNLSEVTTAADLLSQLMQADQEQADQEQIDSKAQAPISELTPSKPVALEKESSNLAVFPNHDASQEENNRSQDVTIIGVISDQEQIQKEQMDLPAHAPISDPERPELVVMENESNLTVSTNHRATQGETDTPKTGTATGPISDQEQIQQEAMKPSEPVSKKSDPDLALSTNDNSSQISKQKLLETAPGTPVLDRQRGHREQIDLLKHTPPLDPKTELFKKKDSKPPVPVTPSSAVSGGRKLQREETDLSALTGISNTEHRRRVSKKKDSKLPMLVTTMKSPRKIPGSRKVQVDMSAVVKAGDACAGNLVTSNHDAASVSVMSTANNTMYSTQHSTHLLRTMNFWMPSNCAVCQKLLVGRKSGSQCEVCNIDCCFDCRLNVDLRIPCGPSHSKRKKGSIESILSFVAPDETFERNRKSLVEETIDEGTVFNEEDLDFSTGIGYLKLCFLQAAIFKQPVPSDEHPEKVFAVGEKGQLFNGDYYARVSISNSTRKGRTPTVQKSGLPQFRSTRLFFGIEDYGREFRLDIVDSNTDAIVGSAMLTTQGILQRHRDLAVQRNGASLFQFAKGPIKADGTLEMKLQLRSNAKNGIFGSKGRASDKPSCIVGWLEIEVGIEEYTEKLLSPNFECPERVHPAFRMSNLQEQLKRVKYLLDDLKSVIDGIKYIFSWNDPLITAAALYTHIVVCLRFNSEYGGSLPFIFIICLMLHARNRRFFIPTAGVEDINIRIVGDEMDNENSSKDTTNRPLGSVTVDVTKGADLLSRDGIPGKTSCYVVWDPTRYAGKRLKAVMKKLDKASHSPFEIGHTDTRYTAQPTWELSDSKWNKRLKGLLPPDDALATTNKTEGSLGLSFPVLQPLAIDVRTAGGDNGDSEIKLASWDECPGAVVYQVYFSDVLFGLGVEYEIGEVVIPFSELVKRRRISGWFDVTSGAQDNVVSVSPKGIDSKSQGMQPRIHITLSWQPPGDDKKLPEETSQQLSIAIQEELSHFSHSKKTNIIDSSLGAMNTALGLGGNLQDVQNTIVSTLDLVESVVNLFNFTDPFKSSLVFWAIVAVCIVFLIIPTRVIVFIAGLVLFWFTFDQQFGITKMKIFKKKAARIPKPIESFEVKEENGHAGNVFINALRSLPTREDLRKAIYWEKLRVTNTLAERRESKRREARLRKLWKSQWFSNVKLKEQSDKDREFLWIPAFAVVQGHLFLWWEHARDFDRGEEPAGKVYLGGHAGLTGPSPLEMRELSSEDLSCFVGIFGRGLEGQERISILTESNQLKSSLEDVILQLEEKND
ncbi:unnamed protein product [Cylindrotheca closterium]|uniref:Phorbol-ester/DAG-type domain-containing protein n=1 Tax=Cylindrotheca closterium TaxID=2856 RepID=A0AAD2FYG1_9STRA|nr:unnamed protein product [Cylindrotheca closterium]